METSQYIFKELSDFVRTESSWRTPTNNTYPSPLWTLRAICEGLRGAVLRPRYHAMGRRLRQVAEISLLSTGRGGEDTGSVAGISGVTAGEHGGGITPRVPGTETGDGHPLRVGGNPNTPESDNSEIDDEGDDNHEEPKYDPPGTAALRRWTANDGIFKLMAVCAGIRYTVKKKKGDEEDFENFESMYRAAWERMHHPDPLMRKVCPYQVREFHDENDDDVRIEISELGICVGSKVNSSKRTNLAVDVWCSMYEKDSVRLVEEKLHIPRQCSPEQWHEALKSGAFVITGLQVSAKNLPVYSVEDIQNNIMYVVEWGEQKKLTDCRIQKPTPIRSSNNLLYERPIPPPSETKPRGYEHLATINSLSTNGKEYIAYLYQYTETGSVYLQSEKAQISLFINANYGKETVYVQRVVTLYPYTDKPQDALLLVQFVTQRGKSLGIRCYRHNTTSTTDCRQLDLVLPSPHDMIRCFDAWTGDGIIYLAAYTHGKPTQSARAIDRIQVWATSVDRENTGWSLRHDFKAPTVQSTFFTDRSSYPSLIRFNRTGSPLLRIIYGGIIVNMDLTSQ